MRAAQRIFFLAALACSLLPKLRAQAVATASGPGAYVAVGGGVSAFQADYGHHDITGGFLYADANPHWRVGLEGEARFLRYRSFEDVTESNYLGGLRLMVLRPRRFQPYGKFLAGMGKITLPFDYAHGSFLTYAPGAGLDIAVNSYVSVRAVDFEYQHWPRFTYGALSPYGLSAGISLRLNPVPRYPRSLRIR